LNLGDSYTSGGRGSFGTWSPDSKQATHTAIKDAKRAPQPDGLKPKDLVGIPWRVAFALQADGWYLRSDIIWNKPNPMPESVTDRPTKAHEYVFLLSKAERYYYDAAAIREPDSGKDHARSILAGQDWPEPSGVIMSPHRGLRRVDSRNGKGRNRRSVWTIPTQPYCEAHFATFPEALVEPCILAGSRTGDVVLDPFFGSGTVGQVAERLGRRWIGCELNPQYVELSKRRTAQIGIELG
jgi:site-specific DNA-methyltransferase (cytosine-N4-specific)